MEIFKLLKKVMDFFNPINPGGEKEYQNKFPESFGLFLQKKYKESYEEEMLKI